MAVQPSFRLDARTGWRERASDGIAWSPTAARIAARPGVLAPLDDPGGALGGRAMPRRVAAGPGGMLVLITGSGRLVWYDPCTERFTPIPCGQDERMGFGDPIAITITAEGELLVLDGTSRIVTAIWLADWRIRRHIGPFTVADGALHPVKRIPSVDPATGRPDGEIVLPDGPWTPRDIAALPDGRIAISEAETGMIAWFDHRGCLLDTTDGATAEEGPLDGPDALAVDDEGSLYVLETGGPRVAKLDLQGRIIARGGTDAKLPELIEAGALAIDRDGTIWVSSRRPGAARPLCCDPSGRIRCHPVDPLVPAHCALLAFDSEGRAILGSASAPCVQRSEQVARLEHGYILFERQDGGQTGTVWDRTRLDVQIPPGTSARLATYTSDAPLDDLTVDGLPEAAWSETQLNARDGGAVAAIRSAPGRYLWMRLTFGGDGIETPVLHALTVTYPRRSSARHLPAVWSSEPQSADFLARFMMLFDEVRADVLTPLEGLAALIDPKATPAADAGAHGDDFLDWLGGWIGLALDRNWSVDRRRRLVAEAPSLFRIKGTVEGLKRHVEIYTGIEARIVEHFRLRRWMVLDETALDGAGTLWGPDLIRRLELDGYAEIGRFALVDGGDPLTDPVAVFAHRATVYVPVATGFTDVDLAALEAVVEAARPAHVAVDVRVMEPRFVMGCDTLLGVNTILGTGIDIAVTDESILGEDIRLAGPPHAFSLSPGTRLGHDTTLD